MEKEVNWKYIVYCTMNKINNNIYVGVHKTATPDIFDGYIGNGMLLSQPYTYKYSKTKFQCAVNKYGVKNFIRCTLAEFNNELEAYEFEELIVNESFLKRNDVYNMILGGNKGLINSNKLKVYQYDLNGIYITEYISYVEASKFIGCDESLISHAVRKKSKAKNYFWSTDKLEKLDLSNYNLGLNQKLTIYYYSIKGEYIGEYESISKLAKEIKTNNSKIIESAKIGNSIGTKGYANFIKADSLDKAKSEYIKTRTIYQYDINGKYLEEYVHQIDAEKKYPKTNITKALNLKQPDENNYLWGLDKLEYYNASKINISKQVGKYDLSNNLIKIYPSATNAVSENGTSVWKVLKNINKTNKNHIYKYID